MNIVFLRHNEIDKQKWDEVIASSQNTLPYAYSWYLDCVCPEWNALVGDDYQYVFPLTANTKFGIKYLYQPYFAQQLGLFSKHKISTEEVISFLKAIPEFYKLIEINLNFANTVSDSGFQVSKRMNFELQLDKPYTEIKKFYSDNHKRNIAKAEKSGLFVTDKISIRQVIDLFKHDRGAGLDTMKEKHYKLLEKLFDVLEQKQLCFVKGVTDGKQLYCGALFIKTANRIIFIFSGNSAEGKSKGAMSFLIDSVIETFSNKPMIFDFEGSNHPGLARFYSSFGSIELVYLHLKKNTLSYPLRLLKK